MNHLVVVAAGTGGHVMPGIAVAEALRGRGWSVSWLGTQSGMERGLVERHGIAFDSIDFSGLRGKGLKTLLLGGFLLLRALWQSRARLRARSPKVVFTTGGYVAVPAGMAASTLGVPLVLMNSDADSLLSTRLLSPIASGVLCGFDGAAAQKAGAKGLVTGNPVRAEIAAIPAPVQRYTGRSGPLPVSDRAWFTNAEPNMWTRCRRRIATPASRPRSSRSSTTSPGAMPMRMSCCVAPAQSR